MKILLISSYLPYPLTSGGHVRLYNLMKLLSKKHEITLLCEKRSFQTQEDVEAVEKICKKVLCVPRKKQWSINNILRSGLSSQSFLITGHTLSSLKQLIDNELATGEYDLIHVETSYVMQNIPMSNTLPIVLVEHNIEYQVYERFMNKAPRILRPLLSFDIKKLKKTEELLWTKAAAVAAVSDQEKKIIGEKTSIVPNGVDLSFFQYKKKKESKDKKVLFIGDFSWIQNKDTIEWIIKEIWPRVNDAMRSQHSTSNSTLWIVGRKIPKSIKKLANDSIFIDEGNTLPTYEIFQEATMLLAPIRVGGGTSYKILEAMAVGTPVVTTVLGNEGIDAVDGKEILIADTAATIAEKTITLLTNTTLAKTLSEHGRKVIEEKFSWEKIAQELDKIYETVVKKI